jgi:lysophospholipase L1-like esterase
LARHLPECQVLNFGVSGYSLGQMYLRYRRDVLPFQPDIVILALSSNSTNRTMGVYEVVNTSVEIS